MDCSKLLRNRVSALLSILMMFASLGCASSPRDETWTLTEMATPGPSIPVDLPCWGRECTFRLFYYTSPDFDSELKTILFIAGGPGAVMDPRNRMRFLEKKQNVVYFHLRGSGLSPINASNEFDRYLRANFVVSDIEVIRRHLKLERWHGIYGHSHGAVIAQQYAQRYGKVDDRNPIRRVDKLILSVPPARQQGINFDARRKQTIENLVEIYKGNGGQSSEPCKTVCPDCTGDDPRGTDNFCFLTHVKLNCEVDGEVVRDLAAIECVKRKLDMRLKTLEAEFGATGFVIQNYEELWETNFKEDYPFPKEFFIALKTLEFIGSVPINKEVQHRQISAVYIVLYETLEPALWQRRKEPWRCSSQAPMWKKIAPGDRPRYCQRYANALDEMPYDPSRSSLRAYYVFGIYDGINRFVLGHGQRTSGKRCVGADTLAKIVNDAGVNEVVRRRIAQVGQDSDALICAWDPGRYQHPVPSLIFKAGGDPLTAGGQPEYVFQQALTGPRVLIEFPGTGHGMLLPRIKLSRDGTNVDARGPLVDKFLNLSVEPFVANDEVKEILDALGAKMTLKKGSPADNSTS